MVVSVGQQGQRYHVLVVGGERPTELTGLQVGWPAGQQRPAEPVHEEEAQRPLRSLGEEFRTSGWLPTRRSGTVRAQGTLLADLAFTLCQPDLGLRELADQSARRPGEG